MAENIRKVYPPKTNSKGTKSNWYHDTPEERYEHVKVVLDRYVSGEYDMEDVQWFIKNAVLSRIYISEEALKTFQDNCKKSSNERFKEICQKIIEQGYTDDKYLDIRKFTNKLRYDHVVPSKVFLAELIRLHKEGSLTLEKFNEIRSRLYICILTIKENTEVDKKYRSKMPKDSDWLRGDVFARYHNIVKVYKHK